MPELTDRR